MNRFVAAVSLVAGIALPICWFWHKQAAPHIEARATPHSRSLADKLNTIIIPDYPNAGITLAEAIEHLSVKSRKYDTLNTESGIKGVNIVIIAGGERQLPAASGLPLRDVPLAEALRHVTGLVNLKYTIEPHAVAVRETQDMRTPDYRNASALQRQFEKRVLPTVNWQNASLGEAVEYLRISRGCLDASDTQIVDVPFNFVVHLREAIKRPAVSLELKDIPMSEALRYCAEISNSRLRYDTAAVMITDVETDASAPEGPANSPVLPTVEFQDATLAESLDFVRIKSREFGPDHREISIKVIPGASGLPITLSLKNISLHETLRYIAELSGHKLSVEGGNYVLSPL